MDRILVTGSSGTIGTELCLRLMEEDYNVIGFDKKNNMWSDKVSERTIIGDLQSTDISTHIDVSVDSIIHLAANARVHQSVNNPAKAFENHTLTYNLLEYARKTETDFLLGSSREIYTDENSSTYKEDDSSGFDVSSPYTAGKVGDEAMVWAYSNCYDIEASVLRFSNVYGRFDASNRVVPLFLARASNDLPLKIYGENKILDFTYVSDCVSGILSTLRNFREASGETFNIASGTGSSLVTLAELIKDRMKSDSSITVEPSRTGEMTRFVANIDKAHQYLGYDPDYDLESGLNATIDWYESHDLYNDILEQDS